MSRCFPFPPPGYTLGSAKEALIESIKLQREREKAKAERKKEKKRVKEEEKKQKREKRKREQSDAGSDDKTKLNDQKIMKASVGSEGRSDLTEEHEQPVRSQNPSNSCDSTQNSDMTRRHASSLDSSRSHGNIIRIRLSSKKPNSASEEQCTSISISGRTDLQAEHKHGVAIPGRTDLQAQHNRGVAISERADLQAQHDRGVAISERTDLQGQHKHEVACGPSQEELCSTSREADVALQGVPCEPVKGWTHSTSGRRGPASLYKDVVENWVPPSLQSVQTGFDDQEWLFGRSRQDQPREKKFKACGDVVSRRGNSTLWPHSQFLLEADLYALPYTVPF